MFYGLDEFCGLFGVPKLGYEFGHHLERGFKAVFVGISLLQIA